MVVLISAPWGSVRYPSIQLGTLKAVLERAAVSCRTHSLAVDWLDMLVTELPETDRLSFHEYERIGNASLWWGLADWTFAHPPVRMASASRDADLLQFVRHRGAPEEIIRKVSAARELAPAFLNRWADRVAADRPALVGFSTTYGQNQASLVLANLIKQRSSGTKIVFGGANCDGPMGAVLQRLFPWVDIVVRGPGEEALLSIAKAIRENRPVECTSSVSVLGPDGRMLPANESRSSSPVLDDLPIPDYSEYFEAIEKSTFHDDVLNEIDIPFESARGCWWGAKHHCTFCGLNGEEMVFRSKNPQNVVREIRTLASRHRHRRFAAVDNIIDFKYFDTVLPSLVAEGWDLNIFYETKANLTKAQVKLLREADILRIQPGLESLSTPILRLMRKGVTALQNVRLLKWCAEFGVEVAWNIIYGFPLEPADEYPRMANVVRSLVHLEAPLLVPLMVERFSPYHFDSTALGVRITGPDPLRRYLYDAGEADLMDLSYVFEYAHADGRDPESYVGPLRDAVIGWRERREGKASLRYFVGPDHVHIVDDRHESQTTHITLEDWRATAYLHCDAGASPKSIMARLDGPTRPTEQELVSFLGDCLDAQIVYLEDDKFLGLAVGTGKPSPVTDAPGKSSREEASRKTIPLVPASSH